MNKKLSKEDLKWEDDSYLMREIHEKFVKVDEKMEHLEAIYYSDEVSDEDFDKFVEELKEELSRIK